MPPPTTPVYSPQEIDHILAVLRRMFPRDEVTPALRSYWGWERGSGAGEDWGYITTDFHSVDARTLIDLHEYGSRLKTDAPSYPDDARQAAIRFKAGYSIGICPWGDNALLRTADPAQPWADKDLVVVVGKDCYPIAGNDHFESPLWSDGMHNNTKYRPLLPRRLIADEPGKPVVLFLNLYPDYRPPGNKKTGAFKSMRLTFAECIPGLQEVLRIVAPKFARVSVITWGAEVFKAIRHHVDGRTMTASNLRTLQAQPFREHFFQGHKLLPTAHVSFGGGGNHRHDYLDTGYAWLGLGRRIGSEVKAWR